MSVPFFEMETKKKCVRMNRSGLSKDENKIRKVMYRFKQSIRIEQKDTSNANQGHTSKFT
jgi:hypothetical protein